MTTEDLVREFCSFDFSGAARDLAGNSHFESRRRAGRCRVGRCRASPSLLHAIGQSTRSARVTACCDGINGRRLPSEVPCGATLRVLVRGVTAFTAVGGPMV